MENNFLKLNERDLLLKVPKKYYFEEQGNKFIYNSLANNKVIALANSLNDSIVEVKKQKLFNKKNMSFISRNGEDIGWVHLKNSKKLFRLPNVQGKFNNISKPIDTDENLKNLVNGIIKASYIFFEENEPILLVNKIGSNMYGKLHANDFYRAQMPGTNLNISIDRNTMLYKDSQFSRSVKQLEKNTVCKVILYFENLNELRIQLNGKLYWIKKNHRITKSHSEIEDINYELVDMLVYLKELNKKNNILIHNQNNKLKNIESNIEISNDLQKFYLKKYVGDIYESE
ncbi:hypothetical protein WN59_10205 [Salinicoccus sediminis]|uniref:GW domain-containing protein n=1 Tax=Salinicoccus sediminis TaxID=1432562 RepID=A0A0M2SI59_9STAP|nr:GW dipeptide domain-containing protein [Salinicoccus sediminis]KKK33963.1 hypothetical protein WN59_10205 [Salinicoccus sediminis]